MARAAGELPWPLLHIVDENRRDTGLFFVRGPLESFGGQSEFDTLRADHRAIGLTSMGPYPLYHEAYGPVPAGAAPSDGWRRPYVRACQGWVHCFSRPDEYLPPGVPRLDMSESDFTNPDRLWKLATDGNPPPKRWDVVYSCLANRFNEIQKNWDLAKECIRRLSTIPGLRILLVGRTGAADLGDLPGVETCGFMPWQEFLQCVVRARVAFFPNSLDSSPRVIAEALALDVPVVVNERILGGWKYVTSASGEHFRDESDVLPALAAALTGDYHPREWFTANYGPVRSQERLASFLGQAVGVPVERAMFTATL